MVDPNISLQAQPANLGVLGQGFDEGVKSVSSLRQSQEVNRDYQAKAALRGILSSSDPQDPNYLSKVQQGMQQAGFGDVGSQFVMQQRQAGLDRQKTQGDIDKTQGELAGQKLTQSGQGITQDKEIQDMLKVQAATAARAALATTDPAQQKAIHDSFVQNVQMLKQAHPNANLGHFDPSTLTHEDWNPQVLKQVSQLDYTPEQRIAAQGMEADNAFKGDLDKYQQQYKAALAMPKQFDKEAAVAAVRASVLRDHPRATSANAANLSALFPTPQRPQQVNTSTVPPSDKVISDAAQRIADRSSTIDQELKNGRWAGATYAQAHDMLVNAITAKDPSWTEQQAVSGAALGKQPATSRYVAAVDNFRSTMERFQKVVNNLGNTPSPELNKLKQAVQRQAGDLDQARADAIRTMGSEEGAAAFQRSGTGSDVSRGWAADAADITANPQATKARIGEILMGLDRSRIATEKASYGYVKPPEYDRTDGEGKFTPGRKTLDMAKKALTDSKASPEDKVAAQKILDMAK